jgi:Uma2 family endonuclease
MSIAPETKPHLVTAEEALDRAGQGRWELIRGEIKEMPAAGEEHGYRVMWLAFHLLSHVQAHGLGVVYAAETGFLLSRDPDTIRAGDVVFISADRVPERFQPGWSTTIPDLVAEVVSPSDRAGDVEDKVADWLEAGVRLVWVLWPRTHTVQAFRSFEDVRTLTERDTLDGEDIVPGFSLAVRELFKGVHG